MITNDNFLKAINDYETRALDEVRKQADYMRSMLAKNEVGVNAKAAHVIPLGFNHYCFKGTKPTAIWIGSRRIEVPQTMWCNFVSTAIRTAVQDDKLSLKNLRKLRGHVFGTKRIYVAASPAGLNGKNSRPVKIGSRLFVETTFDAEQASTQVANILDSIGYDYRTWQIEVIPIGVAPNAEVVAKGYLKGVLIEKNPSKSLFSIETEGSQLTLDTVE